MKHIAFIAAILMFILTACHKKHDCKEPVKKVYKCDKGDHYDKDDKYDDDKYYDEDDKGEWDDKDLNDDDKEEWDEKDKKWYKKDYDKKEYDYEDDCEDSPKPLKR